MHGEGAVPLRDRQDSFSSLLLKIARDKGFYMEPAALEELGERLDLRSKESVVYWDQAKGKVFKVKDPFASSGLKKHAPEDALYEHIIHNIFFPDTRYGFIGVTEKNGELRFILSQDFIESVRPATDSESEKAASEKGLVRKDAYCVENEFVEVTDLSGQNAILRADGSVAFIDPVISHKVPAKEIISAYLSRELSEKEVFGAMKKPEKRAFWQSVKVFLSGIFKVRQIEENRHREAVPETKDGQPGKKAEEATDGKEPSKETVKEETLKVTLEETSVREPSVEKEEKGPAEKDVDKLKKTPMEETIKDIYREGVINYDGLRFELTQKQIEEMAQGFTVELLCKETGEYSEFFYDADKKEIVCKPSFEKTLREKLVEEEQQRKAEQRAAIDEMFAERKERKRDGGMKLIP